LYLLLHIHKLFIIIYSEMYKKTNELNLLQKIEVLKKIELKVPYSMIAEQFKIGKGTVNRIKNLKSKSEAACENNKSCVVFTHFNEILIYI